MMMLQGLLTPVHTEESEKATVHSQRLLLLLSLLRFVQREKARSRMR